MWVRDGTGVLIRSLLWFGFTLQAGPVSGAADQNQPAARGGLPGPHLPAQPGVPGGQAVEGEPGQGQPEGMSDNQQHRLEVLMQVA